MEKNIISEQLINKLAIKLGKAYLNSRDGKKLKNDLVSTFKDTKSSVKSMKQSGLDVDPSVKDSDVEKMMQDDKLDANEKEKLGVSDEKMQKKVQPKRDDIFFQKVLSEIGVNYKKSDEAMVFLKSLSAADGGGTKARFNPLNSTKSVPGSKSINSFGVQSYNSEQSGIKATAETLKSIGNGEIVKILRDSMSNSDDPDYVINRLAKTYKSFVRGSKIQSVIKNVLDGDFPTPPPINR